MIHYHFNMKEKIQLRKWSNLKILDKLKTYIEKYPDIRFCQLLSILDLTNKDNWNEESIDTLNYISNKKI